MTLRNEREYQELEVQPVDISETYIHARVGSETDDNMNADQEDQEPASSSSGAVTVTDGVDEEREIDEQTDNIYLTTEEWHNLHRLQFSPLSDITTEEWNYREQMLQDGLSIDDANAHILS